jgi:hypothetical protein
MNTGSSPSGVTSNGISFLDSQHLLGAPENPNQDTPLGHTLPFPMALVDVSPSGDFQVDIELLLK